MRFVSFLVLLTLLLPAAGADDTPHFPKVRNLLERKCLGCHNATSREGGLSLATAADARAGGESGPVIEAGEAAASLVVEYITGDEPRMPRDGTPLTEGEVRSIRDWINAGAEWPADVTLVSRPASDLDWWSLRPVRKPPLPALTPEDAARVRTPIDAFILARLRQENLAPSPEADRRTLIRRLTFDLIGLPPSPDEVDAFVRSTDPLAYERLVERLLASPPYGERWARHWLDVVHYGDTHGYDKDKLRPNAWPYRDYVIRALNDDKPYGRWVQEQLAGDVLWPASPDGIAGTGFIAAGPWDFIGHAEVPETKIDGRVARHLDRDDMVTTTFNAFLSTTVQCAQCHNHKFDPITQEDYYSLQAVFAALDRADRPFDADPDVARQRAELAVRERTLHSQKETLAGLIEARRTPELRELEAQIAALEALLANSPSGKARSDAYGYHSQVAQNPETEKWVQLDLGEPMPIDHVVLCGSDEYGWSDFGFPDRYRIEISNDPGMQSSTTIADETRQDARRPGSAAITISGGGRPARYVRVTATRLWSRRQNGEAPTSDWIFALGEMAVLSHDRAVIPREVTALDSIEALPRWGRQNLTDGIFGRYPLADLVAASESPAAGDSASAQQTWLARWLLAQRAARDQLATLQQGRQVLFEQAVGAALQREWQELNAALAAVDAERLRLPPPQLVYAGTVHTGSGAFLGTGHTGGRPREIRVLARGDVTHAGPEVRPGTLPLIEGQSARFELPESHREGDRRVALAQWITHHDNPLTWRSIVNRIWQYHFGRALVDSPNDFGRMGQLPTHPELLDWLAAEFRDGDQSLKTLHRLIVNSATYRQTSSDSAARRDSSAADPAQVDADNRLLWRMNRRKLEAEAVRDAVLSVAGKLDRRMGGAGFQDFVLERPEHSPHYEYDKHDPDDPATHRRSIYRFLVRSQPQPFMDTLDCADPSQLVDRRNETLTALQALTLMNNPFMLRMSEHLAARLSAPESPADAAAGEAAAGEVLAGGLAAGRELPRDASPADSDGAATPGTARLRSQLARAFETTLSRAPTSHELEAMVQYAEQHGLPNACRVIFNLNEFVFVD